MAISHPYPTHYQIGRPVYSGPPPSPPMEHTKCTLPSISNLIGLADAGSPTHEHPPHMVSQPQPQPQPRSPRRLSAGRRSESRPSSGYASAFPHHPRGFPPSPPMSTDTSLESSSPPCQKSAPAAAAARYVPHHHHNASAPAGYHHETTPPLESDAHHQHHHHQRHYSHPVQHHDRRSPSMAAPASPHPQQQTGSYFPPQTAAPRPGPGLAYQRPLPQSFPPAPAASVPVAAPAAAPSPSAATSPGAISWQHHHYLNPAPGHLFPQSQDRYICQTCNKAFSRPSSLRIHSHSHTGEKPFKCSQAGCGKAFSVRSNMKRHERGCHSENNMKKY
ncbi:Zinc finger, C2H2 type [Geosmithia morbida]|uniref:Zinc finger, C2H2 type n=1 Tax=Geosmithia morbida TaxID=1094350 RepID=A0A9P5D637_9HYPO|nr:Zinc finger, C2H2 type [Geosmithia morbida]KAF4124400.1 Zinc finger, C2H2 type [Geosmithia morbida]